MQRVLRRQGRRGRHVLTRDRTPDIRSGNLLPDGSRCAGMKINECLVPGVGAASHLETITTTNTGFRPVPGTNLPGRSRSARNLQGE